MDLFHSINRLTVIAVLICTLLYWAINLGWKLFDDFILWALSFKILSTALSLGGGNGVKFNF
ncbi:hypothetical protein [Membranihabitans marinus]|uniref:hypothetical protein n=1 Tax=Membranihabitans marinus TaxID=1227546 RepID=UPI001F270DB8|nr:hypothetical protein [Membranihabitans marinus]